MKTSTRNVNLAWLLLIALTLGGTLLGESSNSGFWTSVLVAGIMALKGRMVIDHFLELGDAHHSIRRLVRLYATLLPLLVVISYFFGPHIARLTAL